MAKESSLSSLWRQGGHWRHAAVPPPMPWPPLPHAALPGPPLHGQGRPRCPTLPLSLPPPLFSPPLAPFASTTAVTELVLVVESPPLRGPQNRSKRAIFPAVSSSPSIPKESARDLADRRRRPVLHRLRPPHLEPECHLLRPPPSPP